MILPINSPAANLENAGGKGANLSQLARAGFQVPDGFIITTDGYLEFIKANDLGGRTQVKITETISQDSAALEQISKEIRASFSKGTIPNQIKSQVKEAHAKFDDRPVAVRSSATAEDLPHLSFAGQQDTFLNVIGLEALFAALVDCWSSLWTARAIGYRTRNKIPHNEILIAVIVQEMVPAEVSGVLFTANPLTGSRIEAVIDATFGLGEALVSGQVEPDHYLVDLQSGQVLKKSIGSKEIALQTKAEGGLSTEKIEGTQKETLSEKDLILLIEMGKNITKLFNHPQDIEWGIANGKIYLLQSRPITSLFPIPDGMSPHPLQVLFSFGSVQGILEPITPLGQDAIRLIFAGGASLFGFNLTHESQPVIKIAGERLWGDITAVLQNPIGSRIFLRVFSAVDPAAQKIIKDIWDEPELKIGQGRLRFSSLKRLVRFFFPFIKRVIGFALSPRGVAEKIEQDSQAEIEKLKIESEPPPAIIPTINDRIDLFRKIFTAFPYVVPEIVSGIAAGLIPLFLLNKIAIHLTGSSDLAFAVNRSIPNNVTTEMDLNLWEAAKTIHNDEISYQHLIRFKADHLAEEYLQGHLPEIAQSTIESFMEIYGMRGIGEIDIGRQRWHEDPTYIFEIVQSYLRIEDESINPDVAYRNGEQEAKEAISELQVIVSRTYAGGIKASLIKCLAERVRSLAGLRESPKFYIIQMMGIIREALLDSGQQLVSAGTLNRADDLFFLYLSELEELTDDVPKDWKALTALRRATHNRELSRTQIPRVMLSDGRAFYEGLPSDEGMGNKLLGSPVSPGYVEGAVRVVHDPLKSELLPGEILTCRGTDPAWTPLFLNAGGLIMEVGGMMTHGAIVAREYGIPAVVGVNQATIVLKTGQRIQLNGSTGEVVINDEGLI